MHKLRNNKGITLVETLIYVALTSILVTEIFSSVHILMISLGREKQEMEISTSLLLENYHE